MSDTEERLVNQLINARHEITSTAIKLQDANKKIAELEEANTRLVDRNWELQKRLVEQFTWTAK